VEGQALAGLPLLADCSPEDLDVIAATLRARRLAPGERLMTEGELGDRFALVLDGPLEVTRRRGPAVELLGDVGPGDVLGELAVLRHRPRTATVTATGPARVAVGGLDALLGLVEHPAVLRRLRDLASARLARDLAPLTATLGDGTIMVLRPLLPSDREHFHAAVANLSPESRRRRFFSAVQPSAQLLDYLMAVDYVDHFAWLAVDQVGPDRGVAVARYVRDDTEVDRAEMAFGVADELQGRGAGTFLLGALAVAALEAGITTLVGHVLEDNAPMRAVFAKAGGAGHFGEPGVLRIDVSAEAAAALLAPEVRGRLRTMTHDVVTAASLALMARA
jgi:CRP-like cAMP-binding protein